MYGAMPMGPLTRAAGHRRGGHVTRWPGRASGGWRRVHSAHVQPRSVSDAAERAAARCRAEARATLPARDPGSRLRDGRVARGGGIHDDHLLGPIVAPRPSRSLDALDGADLWAGHAAVRAGPRPASQPPGLAAWPCLCRWHPRRGGPDGMGATAPDGPLPVGLLRALAAGPCGLGSSRLRAALGAHRSRRRAPPRRPDRHRHRP